MRQELRRIHKNAREYLTTVLYQKPNERQYACSSVRHLVALLLRCASQLQVSGMQCSHRRYEPKCLVLGTQHTSDVAHLMNGFDQMYTPPQT